MTLRIGKQHELPRRPGDWRTSKGDMNAVPEEAVVEAEQMKDKFGQPTGAPTPAPVAPAPAPAPTPEPTAPTAPTPPKPAVE